MGDVGQVGEFHFSRREEVHGVISPGHDALVRIRPSFVKRGSMSAMPPRFKQAMRIAIARVLSRVLLRNIMRDERFFDLWQSGEMG